VAIVGSPLILRRSVFVIDVNGRREFAWWWSHDSRCCGGIVGGRAAAGNVAHKRGSGCGRKQAKLSGRGVRM
jgi:hypothetical protein